MTSSEGSELRDSPSYLRLNERINEILRVDLQHINRNRRIASLRELRRNVVEERRAEYLKDLQQCVDSDGSHLDEVSSDELEGTISPAKIEEYKTLHTEGDESDAAETTGFANRLALNRVSLGRLYFLKNISSILVWPEFITGMDGRIEEEAEFLSTSLMFTRPEGRRVLLVINNGLAYEIGKNGVRQRSFRVGFSSGLSIFDCVRNDYTRGLTNTYFVTDVIMYNNCLLSPSDTLCRLFFLRSRFEESFGSPQVGGGVKFVLVQYHECDADTMKSIYYGLCEEWDRDSLIFVDKRAGYIGGYNPNWLVWRDQNTSRHLKGSFTDEGVIATVLADLEADVIKTLDGVVIDRLPAHLKLTRTSLIKIIVTSMDTEGISITGYKLIKGRTSSMGNKVADTMRKILRCYILRSENEDSELSYQRLSDAVACYQINS